jgi:la-related protein 1
MHESTFKASIPARLVAQLDYYFSDANWLKDKFLQQAADADGYVPISILGEFKVLFSILFYSARLSHLSFVLENKFFAAPRTWYCS